MLFLPLSTLDNSLSCIRFHKEGTQTFRRQLDAVVRLDLNSLPLFRRGPAEDLGHLHRIERLVYGGHLILAQVYARGT